MSDILTIFTERLILKPNGADPRDGADCSRVVLASMDEVRPFAPWVKEAQDHTVDIMTALAADQFEKYLAGTDLFMTARENIEGQAGDWATTVELYNIERNEGICSTGYWTPTSMTGKGYTQEALRALLNHGFQNLNLKAIFATCQMINKPSLRILDAMGFEIIPPEEAPEKHRTRYPETSFQLVLKG